MHADRSGTWLVRTESGEAVRAFLPRPLPPDPPLELTVDDHLLLDRANRALGGLDVATTLLPDPTLFVYMYVRKEAVLSSQIEGTQSSLSDLLRHEADAAPGALLDDVAEVSRYVAAMDHGLRRLRVDGFPLSLRLLREIHRLLLTDGRGREQDPGEFRRSQNWIGGTRPGNATYVPPPPEHVMGALGALERFLHDDPVRTPLLVKAALAHAQFETIHPFLDGNGRLGRLLVTLLLCAEGALREPLLYLSLYFRVHREAYYQHLQRVRTHGEWEPWVRFFANGVADTADQAVDTARRTVALFAAHRDAIRDRLRRSAHSALTVHDALQRQPISSIAYMAAKTGLSDQGVANVFRRLEDLGLLREATGGRRGRLFVYGPYLDLLASGTERPT